MNQEEKDAAVQAELDTAKQAASVAADAAADAERHVVLAKGLVAAPVDPPPPPPPPWTPPEPDGTAEYKADYAVDLKPWAGVDREPLDGASLTPVALPDGPAARSYVPAGGHRAELSGFGTDQAKRRMAAGVQKYMGQSLFFPENYPHAQADYLIVVQVHTSKRPTFGGKQSAVHVSAMNDVLKLRSNPNTTTIASVQYTEPLRRGVWLHFVQWVRVDVAGKGMWAAWIRWDDEHDYRLVIAPTSLDILVDATDWAYWKTGIYSSVNNKTDPHTLLHRLALSGLAFTSVQR